MREIPLYDVEHSVNDGVRMADAEEVVAYAKHISRSRWWRSRSSVQEIKVMISWNTELGAVKRYWARGEIYVWRPVTKQDMLHEAAHILIWKGTADDGRSDHRSEFLRTYVEMTEKFLGRRQARRLAKVIVQARIHGAKKAGLEEWL